MIDLGSRTNGHYGSPRTQTLQLYTRPYDKPDQEDAPQTEPFIDDPSNARATVRAFLLDYGHKLRAYGKDWLSHDGRRYRVIGEEMGRAKFWTWLEGHTEGEVKRKFLKEALYALADVVREDMTEEMPSWLDERDWPAPD